MVHNALFSPGVPGAMASWQRQRAGKTSTLSFTPEHPDQRLPGPPRPLGRVVALDPFMGSLLLLLLGLLGLVARAMFGSRRGEEQSPHA